MAGKFSDTEKDMKDGTTKWNSNMVKVSSSKSILSYQNGSSLNNENGNETIPEGFSEETSTVEPTCCDSQNLKSECLDLVRKKLISDLSLDVFSTDLENKLTKMEPIEISKEKHTIIQKLVVQISQLSDAEKLLLYLKLPSSTSSPFDPLRQPLNPLGNRQEIQQTIVWIKTHLEEDREISIPKQDVYDQYLKYCENVSMKPLSTADFGKVMKQVYPGVRPRRLGTRGNSRYCYSGMRNTCKLPTPILPHLGVPNSTLHNGVNDGPSNLSNNLENTKKSEKPKRKLKSSSLRNVKAAPVEKEAVNQIKNPKRSKVDGSKGKEVTFSEEIESKAIENCLAEVKSEEIDLGGVKCEESSDSFNAFDNIDYELGNDFSQGFGIYFDNISGSSETDGQVNGVVNNKENCRKVTFSEAEVTKRQKVDSVEEKKPFAFVNGEQEKKETKKSKKIVPKGVKKSYVPIQPKPVLNLRFDAEQFPVRKKDSDLCEESDSQEPEEEIVRYFGHLEETNQIVGSDVFVGQAVKNIENSLVQINNGTSDNFPNVAVNDFRSQSCFEVDSRIPNSSAARSQSSVEFSGEVTKKERISHLRILLEKSTSHFPSVENKSSCAVANAVNNAKKVPESPNTRTKFFSFTPISPGPQSPLKTPSTPSASPFVSPRNTPVPRSRQNSSHFVPPTETLKPVFNTQNTQTFENFRPRSFSSTNFYRSKARRNLSKMLSYDATCHNVPNPFPVPQTNEALSNEVRRLLETSKEGQVPGFRSQSVPLNRMMGDNPYSNQVSPVYGQYFNFTPTPVPSEFSDFPSPSSFIPNSQFPVDNHMNQLFPNNFPNGTNAAFSSGFPNANANFDFPAEDPLATANPSSLLPTDTDEKIFKSDIFNDNVKDPVITSFKPVLMNEFSTSPDLDLFGSKINEDSQLIEFLNLEG